jgi:hypothetical protein
MQAIHSLKRGHFDVGAQCRLGEANRNATVKIGAVPFEERVILHLDDDVEIASGRAGLTVLARPANAKPHTGINASGDIDRNAAIFDHMASAAARPAGMDHNGTGAAAGRTGRFDAEGALRLDDSAAPAAHLAACRLGAWFGSVPLAGGAVNMTADADVLRDADRGLL